MARYQVILAYDGTGFEGFQRQAKARTVQSVVEAALRQIGWQGKSLLAAGRTDTGVHASGQVIAFDLDWGHTPEDLQRALNACLPQDVAAQEAHLAEADFHPRYDAVSRRYSYRILCKPVRDPLHERFAWRIWPALDLAVLQGAALALPGRHDFGAFGSPPRANGSTLRTVFSAGWQQEADLLTFEIVADAFLYHMVRRLVSLQVEIAQGRLEPGSVEQALQAGAAKKVQGLAPAHGLVLEEVKYR